MLNFKKLFASAAAAAIVATQAMSAVVYGADSLNDPEFDSALSWMYENSLTMYNTADAYRAYDTLTREQAAKFYANFAKAELGLELDATKDCNFSDLDQADPSLKDSIVEACQLGLFKGTDGKFMPTAPLTKAAALTVLVRATEGMMDENVTPWYANYFAKARELWYTKETDVNAIDREVTRYEIALLLYRASDASQASDDSSDLGDLLSWLLGDDDSAADDTAADDDVASDDDDVSNVEGSLLEVSLDPDTPRSQYVPGTGSNINVMKIALAAGSEDVDVDAITVKLQGLVSRTNLTAVYLQDADGKILTNQREFNTNYEARLVFEGNYVVPANTVKKVYLAISVAGSVNEIYSFSVDSAEKVEASVDVQGDFPIQSYNVQTTSYSSETLTFTAETGANDASPSDKLYVGDTNKRIGKFDLQAGSANKRDLAVKTIRLKGVDQLEGIVDNVKLVAGWTDVDADVVIDGKYITFTMNYDLTYGDQKTFYVYGDVVGWEANDRIQLYLSETTDVTAIEKETGAATNLTITANKAYANGYAIQEGDNLISKSSESPSSSYIPTDEDDLVVLVSNVNISNPMDVELIRVYATGTNLAADVDKMKLYVNDKFIDEDASYDATNGYYEFSYYDYLQGSNKFIVKIDTTSSATPDNVVQNVQIKNTSIVFGSNAEYVSSKNTVASSDIKGQASSATFTIKAPAIESVSRTDWYSAIEQIVKGIDEYSVMKFTVQANNVRDIRLNGFTVSTTAYSGASASDLSNLRVLVDGEVVDSDNFNNGTATFSSLNIPITKGQTEEVELTVDINSSFSWGFAFSIASWDVEDSEWNTVSTSGVPAVSSVIIDVIDSGELYVERDNDSPSEAVLSANPNNLYEVARFKFKAANDSAQLQELTLANLGTNAAPSVGYITGGTAVSTAADAVVNKVYLYNSSDSKIAEATMSNGYAYFALGDAVKLTKDQWVTVKVKVKLNEINSSSLTNKALKYAVLLAGASAGTKRTKVVSDSNGEEITDGGIVDGTSVHFTNTYGYTQYVRATKLTVSDVSQSSTSLDLDNELYKFTVAADSANPINIKELRLRVSVGDATDEGTGFRLDHSQLEFYYGNTKFNASDVEFYNAQGACTTLTGGQIAGTADMGVDATTTEYCVKVVFTGSYSNGYDIGSQTTFKLRGSTILPANNDSLSVRLQEVSTDATIWTYSETAAKATSIIWTDNAATSTALTTSDWFTDAYVETLPQPAWSLNK